MALGPFQTQVVDDGNSHRASSLRGDLLPGESLAVGRRGHQASAGTRPALKSYTLLAKYQIRRRSDFTGQYQSYAVASQIQVDRGTGRFFLHTYGQAPAPPAPQKNNEEYLLTTDEYVAFDGEKTTRYTKVPGLDEHGNESKHFIENATILAGRSPSWIVEPEDILGCMER